MTLWHTVFKPSIFLPQVITETEKGVTGLARSIESGFRDVRGPPPPTLAQVFEGRIPTSPQHSEEL